MNNMHPSYLTVYSICISLFLQDADVGELSVLTDRAQGGTSLTSGTIETMVHRRTLLDDIRGVNEPLNETVAGCRFCDSPGLVVRGTHFLALEVRASLRACCGFTKNAQGVRLRVLECGLLA